MGYCPFPALGHDPGIASQQDEPGVRVRVRRPGARSSSVLDTAATRVAAQYSARQGPGVRATWVRQCSVVTQFLVSRPGLEKLVSRHTSWCCDMVGLHGVATRKRQVELKWCRDTVFDVAHGLAFWCRDPLFGVVTWSCLLGVAT